VTRIPSNQYINFKKLKINIHADDFGASNNITSTQLELFTSGDLDSASILTNCVDFVFLKKKIKEDKLVNEVNLYVHLNLIEGQRLSTKPRKTYISDSSGTLNLSFAKIMRNLIFLTPKKKSNFLAEINDEWTYQVKKLNFELGAVDKIFIRGVDSHMHLHLIPKLFGIANELALNTPGKEIRVPYEKIYISEILDFLHFYFWIGLLKSLVIKIFVKINRIDKSALPFVGIIYSGRMSQKTATRGINNLLKYSSYVDSSSKTITVLFHPGRGKLEESEYFTNLKTKKWYLHQNRDEETNEVRFFRKFLNGH